MKFSHTLVVSVPVSDQSRAKTFYVETLGLELRRDTPFGEDQRWVEVAPKGAETALTLVTWFPSMPPGSLQGLAIGVDEIDQAYEVLRARGVDFHGPWQDAPWGRFATFKDPDGNGLILQENRPGDR